MTDSALYEDPELYDLLFSAERFVVDFYVEQARSARTSVLELACGTGEILIPVARTGTEVIGLDAAPAMLAHARRKADAAGVPVLLVRGDMRTFDLGRQFGRVFVASNSLLHLHELDSFRQFFAAVRRHLAPDGQLIFDVANPDVHGLSRAATERRRLRDVTHPDGAVLSLEESTEYDAVAQVTRSRLYLCSEAHRNLRKFSLRLRNIFPRELELLLESCGFRLIARYGHFDQSPFIATSPHQVCVCEPHHRQANIG